MKTTAEIRDKFTEETESEFINERDQVNKQYVDWLEREVLFLNKMIRALKIKKK